MAARVDARPIEAVTPDDLREHARCHFFAGIGGWELALRWAGWPDDRPVWTGSCPCQPFIAAGKQRGTDDPRHLWPVWRGLIAECLPPTIFGEQVASKAGRAWLAGVRADLEALGYAFGAADLCAACVGAPHIRQRLFWVGHTDGSRPQRLGRFDCLHASNRRHTKDRHGRETGMVPDWDGCRLVRCVEPTRDGGRRERWRRAPTQPGIQPLAYGVPARVGRLRGYGNAIVPQLAAEFVMAYMETEPLDD